MRPGDDTLVQLYQRSAHHRVEIEGAGVATCFYCGYVLAVSEIQEWCDKGQTAICPRCWVDSVLPHRHQRRVVEALRHRYFERVYRLHSMTEVQRAERLARFAHEDQVEESTGDPYVRHLERVVGLVARHAVDGVSPLGLDMDKLRAIAYLHDLLEDTPYSADFLRRSGFSADVVDAIVVLTRGNDDTYSEYIEHILASGNQYALVVKIADLMDHLRPNCPPRLRPRYEAAKKRLIAVGALGAATE